MLLSQFRTVSFRIPLLLVALTIIATACGGEQVEDSTSPSRNDTAPPAARPTDSGTRDTNGAAPDGGIGTAPSAVTGPVATANRHLIDSARRFVGVVTSGDQARFWTMLSKRSLASAGTPDGGSREEIWTAAQEAMKGVERPDARVLGGDDDSMAVLVERHRPRGAAPDAFNDPGDQVIIHWVLEDEQWKAIYPGLSYPEAHLRR